MLKPMFGYRPKPRKFDLPLRYYDPEEEERRRSRIRIEIKRRKPRQGSKILFFVALLSLVVYVITLL